MSDPPLLIRRAADPDWPAVWAIFRAVVATGDTYAYAPETSEPEARRAWMAPGVSTYVAERNGEIVGTYMLKPNQPALGAHVANAGYMVRPGAFGGGIGTAMAEHSLAEARAAGYRAMQFNAVVSTNVRAIALWKRLGFAVIGTVPEGFRHRGGEYVDLLIMYRRL
jgi:L-amino acid N-acyltransferase YncA